MNRRSKSVIVRGSGTKKVVPNVQFYQLLMTISFSFLYVPMFTIKRVRIGTHFTFEYKTLFIVFDIDVRQVNFLNDAEQQLTYACYG